MPETASTDQLTEWREKLELKKIDVLRLKQEAASLDQEKSLRAKRVLDQYWNVKEGKSSEDAESKDLVALFESLPPELQEQVLENLISIQLTWGCNGLCPFCAYEPDKGVKAKFSFESLKAFLAKYGERLKKAKESSSGSIPHYWDSDPFDYLDQGHDYLDFYLEWRKYFPNEPIFISTAVPKGSTDAFKRFIIYVWNHYYKENQMVQVRVSVSKANIQRIEAVFEEIKQEMGWPINKDIEEILSPFLSFSPRIEDDEIDDLGPRINKHDDFGSSNSPSCSDGVVLTPLQIKAITMTAANVYEPSGEKTMIINQDTPVNMIPSYTSKAYFNGFSSNTDLVLRTEMRQAFLPMVINSDGREIILPDKYENTIYRLGRWSFSLDLVLIDIANLINPNSPAYENTTREKEEYQVLALQAANIHLDEIKDDLKKAEELFNSGLLTPEQMSKLEFYYMLTYLRVMQISLVTNTASGFFVSAEEISLQANILKEINKKNIDQIEEIIELLRVSVDLKATAENKKISIELLVKTLGFTEDKKPRWLGILQRRAGVIS